MPVVNVIVSNFGKVQERYTRTPVFKIDEVVLFHKDGRDKYWRHEQVQSWLSFTFVVDDTEPRIKLVLESKLQDADWPSVYSSIHTPDVCAKQCKKSSVGFFDDYCMTSVVKDWQSSPVLVKVVDSLVQSLKKNIEGCALQLDETNSLIWKYSFESEGWELRRPMEAGFYPMIRFQHRPRKQVATIPRDEPLVARSYPHSWGIWPRTVSEIDSGDDRGYDSTRADHI